MIEGGLKAGADPDKAGVVCAATGVDKAVGVKCCRKGAICGGPIIEDREKGGADPDNVVIGGDNSGVEKGVVVKCCRRDAN